MIKQLIKHFLGGLALVLPFVGLAYLLYFFTQKLKNILL